MIRIRNRTLFKVDIKYEPWPYVDYWKIDMNCIALKYIILSKLTYIDFWPLPRIQYIQFRFFLHFSLFFFLFISTLDLKIIKIYYNDKFL
jgi:hypothetical protein